MCSSMPHSGQQSLFPEMSMTGCSPSEGEHSTTSQEGLTNLTRLSEGFVNCELSCKYMGVTLTRRFTLPLSESLSAERNVIAGACVAGLIGDARALGG